MPGRSRITTQPLIPINEARHAGWADRVVFLRDGVVVDSTGTPAHAEDLLEPTA